MQAMANKSNANISDESTYVDNEGFKVCKACGERKQMYVDLYGKGLTLVGRTCRCDRDEEAKEKKKEAKREEMAKFKKRQQFIDSAYRDVFLENSDVALIEAENFINNFDKWHSAHKGLMIWGPVGNGKTFMASCIANELCMRGYRVTMIHTTEALKRIAEFDNEDFKNQLLKSHLVILDDFGVSRNTEYQLEQLNNLIDFLYSNKITTTVTTNLSRKELVEGNASIEVIRTFDRMIHMTHTYKYEAEGRRKEISKSQYAYFESLLRGKEEKQ